MESKTTTRLLTAGVIVAILVAGIGSYAAYELRPSAPTPAPTLVYSNTTVWHNATVYENTTTNVTSQHWVNTTTYVNTTSDQYRNSTVYVNTTLVVTIPVVVVTYFEVNFTLTQLGTNYTVPIPANYSLPVGTVTWVRFALNTTMCGGGYAYTVNAPWVVLYGTDGMTPAVITVDVLLGVPYFPGTYPIIVTVSR